MPTTIASASRCANAVASDGTRAKAPPRLRTATTTGAAVADRSSIAAITPSPRVGTRVLRPTSRTPGGCCACSRISAYLRSVMLAWVTVPSSSNGSMAASASVTTVPGPPA